MQRIHVILRELPHPTGRAGIEPPQRQPGQLAGELQAQPGLKLHVRDMRDQQRQGAAEHGESQGREE
ncbi:hypothetical protein J2S56_000209 [Corynebacterium lowii]|nr:hypothetical protein [Corynebacterium lowii]